MIDILDLRSYFRRRVLRSRLKLLSRAGLLFLENDLNTSAAALSYYTVLTIFPLLLLLLNLGSTIFGTLEVRRFLVASILALLPGTNELVLKNVEALTDVSVSSILTYLMIVIWAGSWIFRIIEKGFSRIWHTDCRSFVRGRITMIVVVLSIALTMMASSAFSSFIGLVRRSVEQHTLLNKPLPAFAIVLTGYFWQIFFGVVALIVTIALFAIVYRFLPNTRVSWAEALPGAFISGLFWEAAKYIFSMMLPYFHYNLIYGSIGAGIALLSWIYISSVIMFYGAQLTGLLYEEDVSRIGDESIEGRLYNSAE